VKILKFPETEQATTVEEAFLADLRERLRITEENLKEINDFLLQKDNPLVNGLLKVVDRYGGVDEINRKAKDSRKLDNLMKRLEKKNSPFMKDLEWLIKQRDKQAFISIPDYRRKILGPRADSMEFDESSAVTLEISAFNFFPWFIEEAKSSIAKRDLMPSRYIRVRSMKEQIEDDDVIAFAAAMQIIGASYVQTLDTKGTMPGPDGKPINVHLGGADTITGYFGGVGAPNEYALKWVDEFLYYYTEYGLQQVLNTNPGTILLGYLMRKLGIDIEFKISVFVGNDNPYSILWTLMTAKLLSRDDGSTPLIGFNLSNSVNNDTIALSAYVREAFGFEDIVRLEHHITEAYRSIVRQPYDRTKELVELADHVKNISAKHEGGIPDVEKTRDHPSDILDYFMPKKDIVEKGLMPKLLANYLDKHDAVNRTAEALTKHGLTFIAAENLHRR
jgi:DNA-binding phage protein